MNKIKEIIERLKFYDDAIEFACRDNNIPADNYYVETLAEVHSDLEKELKELLKQERKEKIIKINLVD